MQMTISKFENTLSCAAAVFKAKHLRNFQHHHPHQGHIVHHRVCTGYARHHLSSSSCAIFYALKIGSSQVSVI